MRTRTKTSVVRFVVLASVLSVGVAAQTSPVGQKPIPRVEAESRTAILSIEGKDNFAAYCAVCHGRDARGKGPATPAMKAPVPDLTTIASRHGGKFDAVAIEYILTKTGKTATPAHGVEDMPIWGQAFRTTNEAATTLRIKNLVKYLQGIQQPSTSR